MPAFHLPLAAAYVVITATTATVWSLLAYHIRLFIRVKIHGPFSWDDIHCTIATIFAILQSSLTVAQTSVGLGRHTDKVALEIRERQEKLAWIANFFYLLALGFSMLSMCFLIARVTKRTAQVKVSYGIAIFTAIWTVACCFVVGFQCHLPTPWVTRPRTGCIDLLQAWIGITVTRCLLELANVIAAVVLLYSVKMPWKPKAIVLAAFSIRLLVIPPSITRLKYIEQVLHSTDWTYSRIDVVILTQISMHVSVILATVPCIRPWLIAFESGGLQAPADVRRESRWPTPIAPMTPKLAPLLPIAMAPPTSDDNIELTTGAAGHRQRVEAWPVQFWAGDIVANRTVTTVEADHAEARENLRKKSLDSNSITRTKSFSVKFEDVEGPMKSPRLATAPGSASKPRFSRHSSFDTVFEDAGGLLQQPARAKLMHRMNSVASV